MQAAQYFQQGEETLRQKLNYHHYHCKVEMHVVEEGHHEYIIYPSFYPFLMFLFPELLQNPHHENVEGVFDRSGEVEEEEASVEGLAGEEGIDGLAEAERDDGGYHPREGDHVVLAEALPEDRRADVNAPHECKGEHRIPQIAVGNQTQDGKSKCIEYPA